MKKTFTFIFSLIIVLAFTGIAYAVQGNPGKSVPAPAVLISPGNGHNVSPDWLTLEWEAGDGPIQYGYRVYFGETNPPTNQVYDGNNTWYSPQGLEYDKEYFWMVVPYNGHGDAENVPVWGFSTNVLVPFFYDPFLNPEGWVIENLSGSPFAWQIDGLTVIILTYEPDGDDGNGDGDLIDKSNITHVWSTLTSPAIDLSGRENVYFFLEHTIDTWLLDPEFAEYYVSAQISIDNDLWHEVARIEVNGQKTNQLWNIGGDTEELFITDIVEGHDQVWLRFEFKSLIDAVMSWGINDIMLYSTPLQGIPGPASNPHPHDGQNTSWFTLTWEPPVEPVPDGFRVYFGENESPDSLVYHGANSSFDPHGNLGQLNRKYYWKVVPYNSYGEPDDVPVWSFTTYDLSTVWIENFEAETIDWVVDNHSESDHEWQFITVEEWGQTKYFVEIEVPAEKVEDTSVWSSVTSPSIDLTGHKYVHLDVRNIFYHQNEFDAYSARILVSVDDEEWVEVKKYEGAIPWAEEEWGANEILQANISQIADDQENVKVRLEFKNNGDRDFRWRVFRVEVHSTGAYAPGVAMLISPVDGSENQPVNVNLEWQQGEGMNARGYRLYMDTSNPPETLVAEGDLTSFAIEDLDYTTEYFWKVVPYNSIGDAESVAVWSFTTEVDATSITDPLAARLQIFPNPAGSQLQVLAADIIQEVRMYDLLGQMVYSAAVNSIHGRINVGQLREGVYLLQVHTQKGVSTHKVQISR